MVLRRCRRSGSFVWALHHVDVGFSQKIPGGFLSFLAQFPRSTAQKTALVSTIFGAYFADGVNLAFGCTIFFFLLLCSCLFLLRCLRALALLFCIFVLLWWWGVALRLSGVLLRVALKHRGSVAAGSRCGLWPADSVGCGDCGLAGLSRWRHQGVVGWHFCLADRSHTVPRNPSPRRNGILPWRGAARLFKRAHPTRVNKSHHWLRACVSEWVTTGFESQRVIIERVCS